MSTRFLLSPFNAEFPSTNFPQVGVVNTTARRPVLAYDGATSESAYWTIVAPQGITTPLTAVLSIIFPTATTGTAIMGVEIEAISNGDATILSSAESLDAVNLSSAIAAPGTAGQLVQATISIASVDSVVAADYLRIKISRLPANASDTITSDLDLLLVELRDAA